MGKKYSQNVQTKDDLQNIGRLFSNSSFDSEFRVLLVQQYLLITLSLCWCLPLSYLGKYISMWSADYFTSTDNSAGIHL